MIRVILIMLGFALLPTGHELSAQANRKHKLSIQWNRLYDYDEVVEIMKKLQATWPKFISMRSIGRSTENRDLWVLEVNNSATGADSTKPAFYSDANIHGNEVQGAEANLYMVWYLMENYGYLPRITQLVDRVAFYVLPIVNVDGRAAWFREAGTSSSRRSPQKPYDDDLDGQFDEDAADDLDGDGNITRMRKRVAMGQGLYTESKEQPGLMIRVRNGEKGEFLMLGSEGIDNDGDGRINEDSPGYYDMNRNWPSSWNPNHLQRGAGEYPLSHPETRAIAMYVLTKKNLAGVQAFHNTGGMILRGPGLASYGKYPRGDRAVYDKLGKDGEFMLPFYRYMIIHKDLYSVAGGFVNWTYEGLGVFSFTNEMWSRKRMTPSTEDRLSSADRRKWEDLLTQGESYVPWKPFKHPFYGDIEIGGSRKMTGRVPPPWMIEEGLHRNAMFNLHHASQMPEIELIELTVRPAPGGLHYVDVKARNKQLIPSRSALSANKKVGVPDRFTLSGDGIEAIAVGIPGDRFRLHRITLQKRNPKTYLAEGGVPSKGKLHLRWIVAGSGKFTIQYHAEKAVDRTVDGEIQAGK